MMFCRFKARQKVKLKLERRATLNKKIPLYRQVYEELRKDIMEGIYQPGEYLPPIRGAAGYRMPGAPSILGRMFPGKRQKNCHI